MSEFQNNTKRKIAILLPTLQVGGAERIVYEELSHLKDDERLYFEIHIVFDAGPLYNKFSNLKIPIHVWNAPHRKPKTLSVFLKIILYLRHEQFDILHVHMMNYFGPWIGRLASLKVILTVHNTYKYYLLQRICMRRSNVLFGCGLQVLKNLKKFIPNKKLKLLTNAISLFNFKNIPVKDSLRHLGLKDDNKIVLSIGRLIVLKGYDLLIEAFHRVVEKEPQAILLIAGEGTEMKKLKHLIVEKGLTNQVRLLGLVNNVDELLEICHVYVNSSRSEGLSVTLLEAMTHKKPLIATDVGGNGEIVKQGETGILVPPCCSNSIADAIIRVLGDKLLQNKLGNGAFDLFQKKYTIEKHCEILVKEYLS